ncbi:MAG: metalloregulator ArsR/SmtB family transcription factor [Pseudomonadota bacterium]
MDIDTAFTALNHPARRQILAWLKDRRNFPPALPEHKGLEGVCVGYIQEKADLPQSTISTHMALLRKAGFVIAERHGQWTFYRRDEEALRHFLTLLGTELTEA